MEDGQTTVMAIGTEYFKLMLRNKWKGESSNNATSTQKPTHAGFGPSGLLRQHQNIVAITLPYSISKHQLQTCKSVGEVLWRCV